MADFNVTYPVEQIVSAGGVTTLNGESGAVNIVAGTGITVTPAGQNITIASTSSGAATSIGALDSQAANANGLALVANVLSTQSADSTHPGMVNIASQSFAGSKTFLAPISISAAGTSPIVNALIDVYGDATTLLQQIRLSAYGVQGGQMRFRGANGTEASPTAATTNKSLGGISAVGYGATQFSTNAVALVDLQAAENYTDTANGTFIRFATTPNGSVTRAERMRINQTGNILIGTTSDNNTDKVQINGSLSLATALTIANGGTGQVTKAAAFDALSPMTTQYDLIVGGAAGTGVRLPKGANGTHLTTQAGVVAWTADPTPYLVSTINSNTAGVSGTTYLCDTSGGAFTVTLPTPAANAFIMIKDKTGSFQTNNLTIAQNAAEKIEGLAASKLLQTNWGAWSFFSDGTDWYMGPF